MATQPRRSVMPTPVRSQLPVPASSKKPSSNNMRMSMAGPPVRAMPRQSMAHSQNASQLSQSTSKAGYSQQLASSSRRTSAWRGTAAPSGSQSTKDPRPLREKSYQSEQRRKIIGFLHGIGYDNAKEAMNNMTGKEYRNIFNQLISWLDPDYRVGVAAKFEDEFVPALKALRYPYVGNVDNKWLSAPASMHCWPSLLGVLSWLVDLSTLRLDYLDSQHPALLDIDSVPEQFDHPLHHVALGFFYNENAYHLWLNDEEEFVEPRQIIESKYTKKDEKVQEELIRLGERYNAAKMEAEKLRSSATPVAELQKKNELLKVDEDKFNHIIGRYDQLRKKKMEQLAHDKAEYAGLERQLQQLNSEQERLAEIVRTQNLSPEEVIRMNSEHESLARNLADLKQKISEASQAVMTLEVVIANRASAAEDAVDSYTHLLSSLGLYPSPPEPFENVDLTMDFNPGAADPRDLLKGSDIKKVIKPTLSRIAEAKRMERASVETEHIRVDNELDRVTQECENKVEEVSEVEKKIVQITAEAEDLREAAQQDALMSSEEASKLERELSQARTHALANGMGVKAHLQAVQFAAREQEDKINRLREETVRSVIKNGSEIAMFKEEVSRHLLTLRECAESENR